MDEKEAEARPINGNHFSSVRGHGPHWGVQSRFRVIYVGMSYVKLTA